VTDAIGLAEGGCLLVEVVETKSFGTEDQS